MTSFQVRTRAHVLNLYHSTRRQQRWTWARIASQDFPDVEIVETSFNQNGLPRKRTARRRRPRCSRQTSLRRVLLHVQRQRPLILLHQTVSYPLRDARLQLPRADRDTLLSSGRAVLADPRNSDLHPRPGLSLPLLS